MKGESHGRVALILLGLLALDLVGLAACGAAVFLLVSGNLAGGIAFMWGALLLGLWGEKTFYRLGLDRLSRR